MRYLTALIVLLIAARAHAQLLDTHIAQQAKDSTVSVQVEMQNNSTGELVDEFGTGFIISPQGFVVTANHVVEPRPGWSRLRIFGRTGSSAEPAEELENIETWPHNDVALLKFRSTAPFRKAVKAGDPASAKVNQRIIVTGFPATTEFFSEPGFITGLGGVRGTWTTTLHFEHGISGAPIFDSNGKVVAMARGAYSDFLENNSIVPINLLSDAWLRAGLNPNFAGSRGSLATMTPGEQVAMHLIDGYSLSNGFNGPQYFGAHYSLASYYDGDWVVVAISFTGRLNEVVEVSDTDFPAVFSRRLHVRSGDSVCMESNDLPMTCADEPGIEVNVERTEPGEKFRSRAVWRFRKPILTFPDGKFRVRMLNQGLISTDLKFAL